MLVEGSARFEVTARFPGVVPHALTPDAMLASQRYSLLERSSDGPWRRIGRVPEAVWRRACARSVLATQGFRLGVHAVARLNPEAILVVVNGRLLLGDRGRFHTVLKFDGFRKSARDGLLVDGRGRIFVAQYARNLDRRLPIRLWRSTDGGASFEVVHRFDPGVVRHIHFVREDPFDGCLWMGTGDSDRESGLYRSQDGGESWEVVGHGGQEWRAISLAFRPEAIYWGTDAGSDAGDYTNRILRLDRADGCLKEQARVQGPVHGVATTRGGGVLLATGVEGGENEIDSRVHLWFSEDGHRWSEIASFARGRQPRRVQYAVAHFVPGQEHHDTLFLVMRGVAGMALGYLEGRIVE